MRQAPNRRGPAACEGRPGQYSRRAPFRSYQVAAGRTYAGSKMSFSRPPHVTRERGSSPHSTQSTGFGTGGVGTAPAAHARGSQGARAGLDADGALMAALEAAAG
jgi:hypothetical protein